MMMKPILSNVALVDAPTEQLFQALLARRAAAAALRNKKLVPHLSFAEDDLIGDIFNQAEHDLWNGQPQNWRQFTAKLEAMWEEDCDPPEWVKVLILADARRLLVMGNVR
jgi:hypothetical protein